MGVCISKTKQRDETATHPLPQVKQSHSMPPPQSGNMPETDKLVKRTFTVILSNIKIKSPPQLNNLSVLLNFDSQVRNEVPLTEVEGTLRWKQQFEFEYTVDDFRLNQISFALLSIRNSLEVDLGVIKLKLIDVATGPYHHDMAVQWKTSPPPPSKLSQIKGISVPPKQITDGRMSFDLKMFQKIEFCITADSIVSNLDHQTDKAFNFSFRLITLNHTYNSEHSENYLNPAYHKKKPLKEERIFIKENNSSQRVDLDEDFNTEMNENAGALKIKNKVAKSNSQYQPELDSPKKEHISLKTELKIVNEGEAKIDFKRVNDAKKSKKFVFKKESEKASLAYEENDKSQNDSESESIQSTVIENQPITWKYVNIDGTQNAAEPPELIVKLTTKDLSSASIQICIWGLHSNKPTEKKDEQGNIVKYMDNHIAGECYVSVNRIFSIEPQMIEVQGQKVQVRKKIVQEKLWNHGKEVGSTLSNFKVINHQYLQQKIVGVQTENGVKKASPSIFIQKDKSGTSNSYAEELSKAKNSLIDSVYSLYEAKSIKMEEEKVKIKEEIQKSFEKIHELCQKSDKESVMSFYYKSQEDLLFSQYNLIEIANHMLHYSDEIEESLREGYYDCLKIIINRGEFNLNYMGFDESYIFLLENAKDTKIKKNNLAVENIKNINQKMKVTLAYQKLLYNSLEKVLNKLNQKALSQKERSFVENFCAIAYFRIPEFREKLLSILIREDDIEITEWRGTEYALDEKKNVKLSKNNEFFSLFDWEVGFYRFLKTQDAGEQHFEFLEKVLNDTKWSQRMAKRGVAFFFFLTEWMQFVSKIVVNKDHVPWQDLPGYLTLLKAFLVEMKTRNVLQYPEAIKIASLTILNNERLLNPLICLIYNKTNLYDSVLTVSSFILINSWFKQLSENNKNIPTVFEFGFFFQGIRMVLEQDHSECLSHAIWLIYNNFTLFPPDFQKDICEYLFSPIFFKFFMHWSYNVRMIFHFFLIYRIHHLYKEAKTRFKLEDDLKRQILNHANQSEKKNLLINDLIYFWLRRMENIVDDAKKKFNFQTSQRQEEQKFLQKMKAKLLEKQEQEFIANSSNKGSSQSILEISFSQENERAIVEKKNVESHIQQAEMSNEYLPEQDLLLDLFDGVELNPNTKAESQISQIKIHLMKVTNNQVLNKEEEYGDTESGSDYVQTSSKDKILYDNKRYYKHKKMEQELFEMEKEYLRYIPQASLEYDQIKSEYESWLKQKISLMPSVTKEKRILLIRKLEVPEAQLKATTDEGEENYETIDEW